MPTIKQTNSVLLIIDLQQKLMPAIFEGKKVLKNAKYLVSAAELMEIPIVATEQNPNGLGETVPELLPDRVKTLSKTTFNGLHTPSISNALAGTNSVIIAGCEAHVCVLQTTIGLLEAGRKVYVVADAVGSRQADNKDLALRRIEQLGAVLVSTEMVLFEWLENSEHLNFRDILKLIK